MDNVQQAEKGEELPKPKRPVRRPAALEPEEQATTENGDKVVLVQQRQQQQQQQQLEKEKEEEQQQGLPPGQQSQSHPSEEQPDQQEPPQHQSSSSDREDSRRPTRSTRKGHDDWLKIPVEATVRVSTGNLETLDGIVYVSVETGREYRDDIYSSTSAAFLGANCEHLNSQTRVYTHTLSRHINTGLFKQQGRVYFETIWRGGVSKFFIADSELPMISGMYK